MFYVLLIVIFPQAKQYKHAINNTLCTNSCAGSKEKTTYPLTTGRDATCMYITVMTGTKWDFAVTGNHYPIYNREIHIFIYTFTFNYWNKSGKVLHLKTTIIIRHQYQTSKQPSHLLLRLCLTRIICCFFVFSVMKDKTTDPLCSDVETFLI